MSSSKCSRNGLKNGSKSSGYFVLSMNTDSYVVPTPGRSRTSTHEAALSTMIARSI